MNILILEDDRILAGVFRDALEGAGHSVMVAHSNDEATALLRECTFHILLFDLLIDGETSIPVLDYANFVSPQAEVILVTGSGLFPRGELHYSIADVSHRLQKPVKLGDLLLVVEHLGRTAEIGTPDEAQQMSA